MKKIDKAFWSIFISFCFFATLLLNDQEAFTGITIGGAIMLIFAFLLVGVAIKIFIKKNRKDFERWFH